MNVSQTVSATVTFSQPSTEQFTVFSAFMGYPYFVIQFLVPNRVFFLFFHVVDFDRLCLVCRHFHFLPLFFIVGNEFASLLFLICFDIFDSMVRCNLRLSSGLGICLYCLLDTVVGYRSIYFTCDGQLQSCRSLQ